jgi:hypothetical protein
MRHRTCIYCGRRADSDEHIVATRFIDVLARDPRGLPSPVLTVTNASGQRRLGGSQSGPQNTLEYTTRVCRDCNNGWMNDVDTAAFPYVSAMIAGTPVSFDGPARAAVATWFSKVALTARTAPLDLLPIDAAWTSWIYTNQTPPPGWHIWVGRYIGAQPWWYSSHDVRVERGPGSAPLPPGLATPNGVLATMVIGYLILQVFGTTSTGELVSPDRDRDLPLIWPLDAGAIVPWPPPGHIDDQGLPLWASRLLATA